MGERLSTTRLVLGGLAAALGVLFVFAASVLPSAKLALMSLASAALLLPLGARGGALAALVGCAAASLIAFILIPNKIYPLAYMLFFAPACFTIFGADRLIKKPVPAFAVKLIVLNLLAAGFIALAATITMLDPLSVVNELALEAKLGLPRSALIALAALALELALSAFIYAFSLVARVIGEKLPRG